MIQDIKSIAELEENLKNLKISEKQFAQLIDYSPDAIRKWRKSGKVPKWIKYPLAYLGMIRESEKTAQTLGISQDTSINKRIYRKSNTISKSTERTNERK